MVDKIEKLIDRIGKEDFKELSIAEQKEFLLNNVESLILEIAHRKQILLSSESLEDMILELNLSLTNKEKELINTKLIEFIIKTMEIMQNKEIKLNPSMNTSLKITPMYIFNLDDKLISIEYHNKMVSQIVLASLVNCVEHRFMPDKETKRKLQLN